MWWTKLGLLGVIAVGAFFLACTTFGLVRSAAGQVTASQPPGASAPAKPRTAPVKAPTPAATGTSVAERTPDYVITGSVVNSRGEPVAGASVVFNLEYKGDAEPDVLSTTRDGQGQFHLALTSPGAPWRCGAYDENRSNLFAYRQGTALVVGRSEDRGGDSGGALGIWNSCRASFPWGSAVAASLRGGKALVLGGRHCTVSGAVRDRAL